MEIMDQRLETDLKKYEDELAAIRSRIAAIDVERQELVKIGTRMEGALAYIKMRLSQKDPEKK